MDHDYIYTVNEVAKVTDGDTLHFRLDLGFRISNVVTVRLIGVDTAEIYGVKKESEEYQRGMRHKKFVTEWLEEQDQLLVKTRKDDTGKYGRYLGYVKGDNDYLSQALIAQFSELGFYEEVADDLLNEYEGYEV